MPNTDFEVLFSQTNALQLLRERNAHLILAFLKETFQEGKKNIGQDELVATLANYLEMHSEEEVSAAETSDIFGMYRSKAKSLLKDWESKDKRYLKGGNSASGQYEYSITEHVVRAWHWLESLENREFTGTQSRLEDIFEKIRRVLENSREKTDNERIDELRQKQSDIEAEINAIQSGKLPYRPFDNVRLKEEYEGLLDQIRALSTDFKVVESNFERIRANMLRQHAAQEGSKGTLLKTALDARDELDRTPQGQSFNGFLDELRNQQRALQFEERAAELLTILQERQVEHSSSHLLLKLYKHLSRESEPVFEANRRIAERITRIVAENSVQNRQLLRQRLAEVKALFLQPAFAQAYTDSNQYFWDIDDSRAAVALPLERNLKTETKEQQGNYQLPQKPVTGSVAMPAQDETTTIGRVEQRIAALLANDTEATLASVVERFPMEEGLGELLAYLVVAAQPSNRHFFAKDATDIVSLNPTQVADGPRVFFLKGK